jgi:CheY-like chemotaxis protein
LDPQPILYAEDEENDVFFLQRAFRQAGISHPLVVAPDGQDAIDYFAGDGRYSNRGLHPLPCLVLIDLNMPKKSGFDVLTCLRGESVGVITPVIVLTSSLHEGDIQRAYRLGANAYLVKPTRPDELINVAKAIKDFWLTLNRV